MTICANCGEENPPGRIFCKKCSNKLKQNGIVDPPDSEDLQERIKELEAKLLARQQEINKLNDDLTSVTNEKNVFEKNHPQLAIILHQLEEKDRALQEAIREVERLRKLLPLPVPPPAPSKAHLVLQSHPIPDPALSISFEDQQPSLDLSTTGFRIRANLERRSDGSVNLVIHPGATVNVKMPGETRWRRLDNSAHVDTQPGMVLFDPKGAANARLESIG
jgi:uncharacterized coiled-coil protein SlyX